MFLLAVYNTELVFSYILKNTCYYQVFANLIDAMWDLGLALIAITDLPVWLALFNSCQGCSTLSFLQISC